MNTRRKLIPILLPLLLAFAIQARTTVMFLPFDDRVELKETWDLSVDVPRWYSRTVDTIGAAGDTSLYIVPFDSVRAAVRANGWGYREYTRPSAVRRLSALFGADYVVAGTVDAFKVVRRSLNGDMELGGAHSVAGYALGSGGATVYGGMESHHATVRMTVDIFHAGNGMVQKTLALDSKEKKGGVLLWMPFAKKDEALSFYNLSTSEFGSVHFHKSVPGAIMKSFSQKLRDSLTQIESRPVVAQPVRKEYLSGTVLERVGDEVYLDLGRKNSLLPGEKLQVMRPERALTGAEGDTLGWVEVPAGTVRVKYIRSDHFSIATISEETDSLQAGWPVRSFESQSESTRGKNASSRE